MSCAAAAAAAPVFFTCEPDKITSRGFPESAFGEIAVAEWESEAVELCALGLELPGSLFFRSLLGGRPSFSLDAMRWNKMGSFRSLDGVKASGVGGSRSFSWLFLAPGTVRLGWGTALLVDGAACSSGRVLSSSTKAGGDMTGSAAGVTGVKGVM